MIKSLPSFAYLLAFVLNVALGADSGNNTNTPAIEVIGNKFFFSNNGSQFYMRGVAYQEDTANSTSEETINDPLANYDNCKRDLPYLQELKTNVIRVYALNTSLDHTDCMTAFADAGIYVIADLSEPSLSINRDSPSWDLDLYNRYTEVVDALHNYTNVLGFFAGNEVSNNASNTDASPFVKAAIRDVKKYISDKGYRSIPVGYSTNDDEDTRVAMADYFACGDQDVKADFYGINMYEWCGSSSYTASGYADRTREFSNLSIPAFFSEYGCNEVQPRHFEEVSALYGSNMTSVWSGGIVYMYFEEANNYGLVSVDGSEVSTLSDFNYLKSEIASISPSSANSASYTASTTSLSCPATGQYWRAATALPPTPEKNVCDCIKSSLTCVLSDDVDNDSYGDLYSYLCDNIDCGDISVNGTTGSYGTYSFCDDETKLSFLLNKYYESQNRASSACSFSGSASLASASSASSCGTILSSASASASSVSASASGNASGSASGSGSSSSSSSTSSSSRNSNSARLTSQPISTSSVILGSVFVCFVTMGLGSVML